MIKSKTVTVIGATGNTGRVVTNLISKEGIKVRAVGRNREKLDALKNANTEIFAVDINNTEFLTRIMEGSDSVLAMIPETLTADNFYEDKVSKAKSIIEAIRNSRIRKVVVISATGVNLPTGIGPSAGNGFFENMLKFTEGISVIVLRCAFLMENHLSSIPMIRQMGIYGSPARSDIAFPMIATRDIANSAAGYLLNPEFEGYSVRNLLGPRDYNYREVTSIIGTAIKRPDLKYIEFPYEDFRKGIIAAGMSVSLADDLVAMYKAINNGEISDHIVRNKVNTTPTTFETFVNEIYVPFFNQS